MYYILGPSTLNQHKSRASLLDSMALETKFVVGDQMTVLTFSIHYRGTCSIIVVVDHSCIGVVKYDWVYIYWLVIGLYGAGSGGMLSIQVLVP